MRTARTPTLDCSRVEHVQIVRQLGHGENNVAYEVRLPDGTPAATKWAAPSMRYQRYMGITA